MKEGDRVRLRSLQSILLEYTHTRRDDGSIVFLYTGIAINRRMIPMFGKHHIVESVRSDGVFRIKDWHANDWVFHNTWIENRIIDVDELFSEVVL